MTFVLIGFFGECQNILYPLAISYIVFSLDGFSMELYLEQLYILENAATWKVSFAVLYAWEHPFVHSKVVALLLLFVTTFYFDVIVLSLLEVFAAVSVSLCVVRVCCDYFLSPISHEQTDNEMFEMNRKKILLIMFSS